MPACPECGAELGDDHRFCPYDGTPVAAAPTEGSLVGRVVADRYRVMGLVGEGGMATIYLARHELLQRDVALKVLLPDIASDPRCVARFAREGRAASRIDHENVVYVLDFGRALDGFYFLAMEHVVGRSLEEDIFRSGRIGFARVLHILAQIGSALKRAHELGVIHRDLKPDNVILTQRGRDNDFVKVLDFGLARVVEPEGDPLRLTKAGEIFGTPEYMAPEQWEGGVTDVRTDVYAFGVMTFQMLTGEMPFEGKGMELWLKHCKDPIPRPSARLAGAGVPEVFDELVEGCMRKNPDQRYQDMGQVLDAVGQAWESVQPSSVSRAAATYAGTIAAPPAPSPDSIPDPTVYRAAEMDVLHDGPALVDEMRRLHDLRTERVREVMAALWGDDRPAKVQEMVAAIEDLEQRMRRTIAGAEEVRSLAQEARRVAEEERAVLRQEIMEASLIASGLSPLASSPSAATLSEDDPTLAISAAMLAEGMSLSDTIGDGMHGASPDEGPVDRLPRAERRLASFERNHLREMLELEHELSQRLGELHETEDRLAPLYEELAETIADAAEERPGLRELVISFEQVDGALAAYKAVLDGMEL